MACPLAQSACSFVGNDITSISSAVLCLCFCPPDGSIRIVTHLLAFCALAPEPYPDWLRNDCAISPEEWYKLVWDITCKSFDLARLVPGGGWRVFAEDRPKFLPQHSQLLSEYITQITPQWAQRGVRIRYHEVKVSEVRWASAGRLQGAMRNWLEFSPLVASPAETHSTAARVNHHHPPEATNSSVVAASSLPIDGVIHVVPAIVVQDSNNASSRSNDDDALQPGLASSTTNSSSSNHHSIACFTCSFSHTLFEGAPRPRFCQQCASPFPSR